MANKRPKTVNMQEILRRSVRIAATISESAQGYIDAMDGADKVKVEIGGFYQTYDGSLVLVVRQRSECNCPVCSGRVPSGPFGQLMGNLMGMPIINMTQATESGEEHDATKTTPDEYVTLLLQGGHGIKDLRGEKPGESFLIDEGGMALLIEYADADEEKPKETAVSKDVLAMAGLCLKRRVKATFSEMA